MKNILIYILIALFVFVLGVWLDPVIPNSQDTQGTYTGSNER